MSNHQDQLSVAGEEAEAAEPLFADIDATQRATEIESYCVNCGENVGSAAGFAERQSRGVRRSAS